MADGRGLAAFLADDHHPHHPARRRIDIAGIGGCGQGKQGQEQGERAKKPGHGAGYSRFFGQREIARDIERKDRGCSGGRLVAECFT
ncbi:hypothetical protein [Porphyrobacter sp. ULC335]|uniref:hypothetical protein n=1 Tax=Porphyrobacter sp. ULC335 TaxID=2854260 RepID=UPI0022207AC2|nr:hypothetical protein [Porphyrobacter sp. ULC335]